MKLLLLAVALAAPPPPGGRVVEEIVAVVRNPASAPPRVVTLTKLTEEARIALVSRGASAAATGPLDAEALRAALDWLLDQMLLTDDELLVTLARMVRVQRYVASRVGRAAHVPDDEVDRWLRDRGAAGASAPARAAARAQIADERTRSQVKELIAELRARADVRIVSAPRDAGEGGP